MLLLQMLGCMGFFRTDAGPDRVRGALFFAPDSTLSIAVTGGRQIVLLLANSSLPCSSPTEDDPLTAEDEVADGRTYYEATFATAFAREGALVVAMVLAVDDTEDWLGTYNLHDDAWNPAALAGYVATDGRVAAGAWYQVDEAAVDSTNGNFYTYSITEDRSDEEVGAPAWVALDTADRHMRGRFSFAPTALSGSFEAERCDNLDLLAALYLRLAALSPDDETLVDDFESD